MGVVLSDWNIVTSESSTRFVFSKENLLVIKDIEFLKQGYTAITFLSEYFMKYNFKGFL